MTGLDENKRLQIAELTNYIKVRLAPSKIHGVGLIALRDLKAGTRLYADIVPKVYTLSLSELKKLPKESWEMILEQWPQIVNGSKFAYPTTKIQAFCNHSNTPNYNAKTDVLLEDVKKGDEITEDYRAIEGYKQVFPWITE